MVGSPDRVDPAQEDSSDSQAAGAELSSRLPTVMSLLARKLRHGYGPQGVSLGWYPVLNSLLGQPAATASELASRERVRLPSMTAIVNQMEADGLVTKAPDPLDRRCVRISLTPAGAEAARATQAARSAWFAARLGNLSPAEVAAISRALPALEHLVETSP
ncbi:MAG TPA: MarR family transcriptional regulator [Candidatus Nanopelagicaceae bacterium]|nr:MarR family transcriptional regulator [Candidatus Nanopelagicaceae bacterium]